MRMDLVRFRIRVGFRVRNLSRGPCEYTTHALCCHDALKCLPGYVIECECRAWLRPACTAQATRQQVA